MLLAKEVIITILRPMAWMVDMEEETMEEDILLKFVVIVERQGIPLIHAIKSVVSTSFQI